MKKQEAINIKAIKNQYIITVLVIIKCITVSCAIAEHDIAPQWFAEAISAITETHAKSVNEKLKALNGLMLDNRVQASKFLQLRALMAMVELFNASERYEEALTKLNRAFSLVDSHVAPDTLSSLYLYRGILFREFGNYEAAREAFSQCLQIALTNNLQKYKASVWIENGLADFYEGEYEKAITQVKKAYEASKGEVQQRLSALNALALISAEIEDYDNALGYLKETLTFNYDDPLSMHVIHSNVAGLYFRMKQFDAAWDEYQKALDYAYKANDAPSKAYAELGLAAIYERRKQCDKAQVHFDNALRAAEGSDNQMLNAEIYTEMAECTLHEKKWLKTESHITYAYNIYKKLKRDDRLIEVIKLYNKLYTQTKDKDKVIYWLMEYITLTQAYVNQETQKNIAKLNIAFNSERREQKNKFLEKETQFQKLKIEKALKERSMLISTLIGTGVLVVALLMSLVALLKSRKRLKHLATTDALTGVANRREIIHRFQEEMSRCSSSEHMLVIMILDIDHFKRINDNLGHIVGDAVLKQFCRVVERILKAGERIGRLGGEEFMIILPQKTYKQAINIAKKINLVVESYDYSHIAQELTVTVSIGVANYNKGEALECCLNRADEALYHAKSQGRNCTKGEQDLKSHHSSSATKTKQKVNQQEQPAGTDSRT